MGNMEKRSDAIARDLGIIGSVPVSQLNRSPGTWFLARVAETVKNENRLKDSIIAYITAADADQSEKVATFSLFGIRTDNRRYIAIYHYGRFIGLYKPSKSGLPNSILRMFRKELKKRGCITVFSNESVYSITAADPLPDISIRFMYAPQIYSKTKSARMSARLQKIPLPAAGKCRGPPRKGNSIRVNGVIGLNTDRGTDPAHKSHFKVTIPMNLANIVKKLKKGILVPIITAGLYGCIPTPTNITPIIDASMNSEKKIEITVTDDCYVQKVSLNGSDITSLDTDDSDSVYSATVDSVVGDNLIEAEDDLGKKAESVVERGPDYTSIDASISVDSSSVQHNHDSAAEVTASVIVNSGGYEYAKWLLDGTEVGSTSGDYGLNVDYVGTKSLKAEFYNSLDDKIGESNTVTVLKGLTAIAILLMDQVLGIQVLQE
jgi:hypothetical protein